MGEFQDLMREHVMKQLSKGTPGMKSATEIRNNFANIDVGVEHEGSRIKLPETPTKMTLDEAITTLQSLKKREMTEVAVHEEIPAFPLEGAWAFQKALQRVYGWANPQPKPGFFGPTPPKMVGLEVAPGRFEQVIWGQMEIPGVVGRLETAATSSNGLPRFVITGTVLQKFLPQIKDIAAMTRQIVMQESIYKGQALRLVTDEEGDVDFREQIKFVDLSKVNEDELVFPDHIMEQVKVNVFTPIEHTEQCRKNRVPLSRKVLLEGPFGTGKTITAYVAAKKAVANGWTFVYLDNVKGMKDALLFAKQFAPCVLFSEDIDRVMRGDRDSSHDDVLNTIDGVDTKGYEIITILTSNEVEKIHKAMLRPGRLDAVISVQAPDAKAAQKLVRVYARDLIDDKEDLTRVGDALKGQIPATIREVVERSKLYAIGRNPEALKAIICQDDLVRAAEGMKMHLELLHGKQEPTNEAEDFVKKYRKMVHGPAIAKMKNQVSDIHDKVLN